jgi:hypothetical protein
MTQKQIYIQLYTFCQNRGLSPEYIKKFILPDYWTEAYERIPGSEKEFCTYLSNILKKEDLEAACKPCIWTFA